MYQPQQGYPTQPPAGYPYQPPPGAAYPHQPPPGAAYPQNGGMYMSPLGGMYPPAGTYQPPPGGIMYPGGAYPPTQGAVMYQAPPGGMYPQPGMAYPLQPGMMYPIPNGELIPNAHVVAASNWDTKVAPLDPTTAPDPNGGIQTGRWSNGLCDCCNVCVPNCLMSTCCPCVALAQVYARVGITSYRNALGRVALIAFPIFLLRFMRTSNAPQDSARASSTASIADMAIVLVTLMLELIFALLVCRARMRVRWRFGIDGNCCADYCVSAWCTCCAIAQMATHTRSYRPGDCSFAGPDVLPPFRA